MVTTASSADPHTNNLPSSKSSPSSMAQSQARENPNSISNFKPKSTPILPQRSRRSSTNTTANNNNNNNNSNILPNFSSLPCFNVKWGRQQQLRCINDERSTHSDDNDDDAGILAMRDKLMLDFRNQVQQIHADFIHNTITDEDTNKSNNDNDDKNNNNDNNNGDIRPWNLRARRAVCEDRNSAERKPTTSSPLKPTEAASPFNANGGNADSEVLPSRRRRKKFSVSLSKQEIDEDLIAMVALPAKRPKKRPKQVQRQIDVLFPGYYLSEITAQMYKVKEHP